MGVSQLFCLIADEHGSKDLRVWPIMNALLSLQYAANTNTDIATCCLFMVNSIVFKRIVEFSQRKLENPHSAEWKSLLEGTLLGRAPGSDLPILMRFGNLRVFHFLCFTGMQNAQPHLSVHSLDNNKDSDTSTVLS